MKSIFKIFLCSIALFIAYACNSDANNSNIQPEAVESSTYKFPIMETTYKGHSYIVFKGDAGSIAQPGLFSGYCSGVVHDPDCPKCKETHQDSIN